MLARLDPLQDLFCGLGGHDVDRDGVADVYGVASGERDREGLNRAPAHAAPI